MAETIPPDWCCVDCLMWLANGETDPEWSEDERKDFLDRFYRTVGASDVSLGMFAEYHDCTEDNDGEIADDCECEQMTFSWSSCATCRSTLGGERAAVTFHN